jgi:hypothetical protein
MGTSAARRAPTSRLWRQAKNAATRYISPEGGGAVTAGEVAARYLAALGEAEQGPLAAFRRSRKVAQDLGAWAALESPDWGELAGQPPEVRAQGVAAALAGAGGGLEDAVAHASLVQVLTEFAPDQPAPELLVAWFLAGALYLRLNLDLGEPLEAAGENFSRLRRGLDEIHRVIEQAAGAPAPEAPADPEAWRGLAGWTWVTRVLEAMLSRLMADPNCKLSR